MRAHRGEAKRRRVAHDSGLLLRALKVIELPPADWREIKRLSFEQQAYRRSRPGIHEAQERHVEAIARGRKIMRRMGMEGGR